MVLASKKNFGAVQIDLDLKIWKNGSLNLEIRISGFRWTGRALEKILLAKTIYGPHLCCWHIWIQPLLHGAPFIDLVLCSKVIPDFRIRMNREGSEKILLVKIIHGLQFLLLTNFDLVLPSRGYSTLLWQVFQMLKLNASTMTRLTS